MEIDVVKIGVCPLSSEVKLPEQKTIGAAGFDICAAEDTYVHFGKISMIKTGLRLDIPTGLEVQVRPRSGLSTKGFIILNSPGTIDWDYTGEVKIICSCILPDQAIEIKKGDRIAQLVVLKTIVTKYNIIEEKQLQEKAASVNRVGGFGSTGK